MTAGIVHEDEATAFIFKYNRVSGQLFRIESYVDNSTLALSYTQGLLTHIEHSNGKGLNISYTTG